MAYPFEIAIDPGPTDAELSVQVPYCLDGGQPSVIARLDIAAIIAACETLEGAVPGSSGEELLQDVGRQLFDAVLSGEVDSATLRLVQGREFESSARLPQRSLTHAAGGILATERARRGRAAGVCVA